MPCWTRTQIEVDVSKLNIGRLEKVIRENDIYGAYVSGGRFLVNSESTEQAEIIKKKTLQMYAAQTIKDGAKRFGWNVKATTAKNNNINIQLGRR